MRKAIFIRVWRARFLVALWAVTLAIGCAAPFLIAIGSASATSSTDLPPESGSWVTPLQIDAHDYNGNPEIFRASALSGGIMTLTGTQSLTGRQSLNDSITIGDGKTPDSYQNATSGRATYYYDSCGTSSCEYYATVKLPMTLRNALSGTATWATDGSYTVTYGGETFTTTNDPNNHELTLTGTQTCNGTPDTITIGVNKIGSDYIDFQNATWGEETSQPQVQSSGGHISCTSTTNYFNIGPFSNVFTFYGSWTDPNTISLTANQPPFGSPLLAASPWTYYLPAEGSYSVTGVTGSSATLQSIDGCNTSSGGQIGPTYQDTLTVDSYSTGRIATLTIYEQSGTSCITHDSIPVRLLNTSSGTPSPSGGSTTPPPPTCNDSAGMGWLFCGLYTDLDNAVTSINGYIGNLLDLPTDEIFGSQFLQAYTAFRDIALGLLVIAGMVMVVSQAAGLEVFSAYTVRKILPRLALAAIGMTLAWPLLQFVFSFFNDIGPLIGQVILSAVGQYTVGSNPETIAIGTIGGAALAVLGGTYVVATISLPGILLFALGIIGVLLVGFLVLALRIVVAMLCVILAPVAIVAAIFPGTERLWKFWKDTLVSVLVMYPLIMLVLYGSVAMAHLALDAASSNPVMGIMALLLYVAGYAMIPFAFRLAGGVVAQAASMINGAYQKTAGGWISKKGQELRGQNWERFTAGDRYKGTPLNAAGRNVGAFLNSQNKLGYLFNKDSREFAKTQHMAEVAARYGKDPRTQATQFNDDMLRAQTYLSASDARTALDARFRRAGLSAANAATRADRAVAAAKAQGGFSLQRQSYALQQLAVTGTGYDDMEDMIQTVGRVAGKDNASAIESYLGNMRQAAGATTRFDLKAGHNAMAKVAAKAAAGTATTADYSDLEWDAWNGANLYQHGNAKPQDIRNAIGHFSKGLASTASQTDRERAAVFFNELNTMLPNATGDVKEAIQGALTSNRAQIDNLYNPTSTTYIGTALGLSTVSGPQIGTATSTTMVGGTPVMLTQRVPVRPNQNAREWVAAQSRSWNRDPNLP